MKITTARLKEIVKEEARGVVEAPETPQHPDTDVRAQGMESAFVKPVYWVRLLLKILDKNEKVNLRLLPEYTDEMAQAIDTIQMWNGFDKYQKQKSSVDEKEVDRAYMTVGGASPRHRQEERYERWLAFHNGLNRSLEDMQGGMYDQTLADRTAEEVLAVLNDDSEYPNRRGYHKMLDMNKDADPNGILGRLTDHGTTRGNWRQRFTHSKASPEAAPKWRQAIEPVRRGRKIKIGSKKQSIQIMKAIARR